MQDENGALKMRNICIMFGIVLIVVIALSILILKPNDDAISDSSTNSETSSITISEILNGRANNYGTTQIYKISVGRGDALRLADLGKDTRVEVWNYDGKSVAKSDNNIPLGSIANGEYTPPVVVNGYEVGFNLITDSSGNNTVYEELFDENGNVKFLFGASSNLSYCTTITVYNKTYFCFIEEMYGDNNYVSGDIIFIEDKEDTQSKQVLLDPVGTQGVTVDGK